MNLTKTTSHTKHSHLKEIVWSLVIFGGFVGLMFITQPQNDAYNKHMCAVYGYQEDCTTPLAEVDKLK